MTAVAARFSPVTIATFGRRFELLLRELGYSEAATQSSASIVRSLLSTERFESLRSVGEFLKTSEIAKRWNRALKDDRSNFLGNMIAPHLTGTVLDLLCGSGAIARYLAGLTGAPVAMVERFEAVSEAAAPETIVDFDGFRNANTEGKYDTVILCTVLHHEPDPEELLCLAARAARWRIIIVENCIDEDCPIEYQELVDLVFNQSLNNTLLPCPNSHRTLAGWMDLAREHGAARAAATAAAAPGIPLSHDMIVIEKRH